MAENLTDREKLQKSLFLQHGISVQCSKYARHQGINLRLSRGLATLAAGWLATKSATSCQPFPQFGCSLKCS